MPQVNSLQHYGRWMFILKINIAIHLLVILKDFKWVLDDGNCNLNKPNIIY